MNRKTYLNVAGLILSTTLVGLILIPLSLLILPVAMVRPSVLNPIYMRATEKLMKSGTQVMLKGIRRDR